MQPNHYQVELGVEFAKNDFVKEYNLPNFLLRTGLGRKAELRLGVNHFQLDSREFFPSKTFVVNTISFKYRFVEENGIIPAIAIQPDINFGFLEGSRRNPEIDYAFVLLFNNTLHQKIFINYNVGILLRREITQILLSASMSFMHTADSGIFLKYMTSEIASI